MVVVVVVLVEGVVFMLLHQSGFVEGKQAGASAPAAGWEVNAAAVSTSPLLIAGGFRGRWLNRFLHVYPGERYGLESELSHEPKQHRRFLMLTNLCMSDRYREFPRTGRSHSTQVVRMVLENPRYRYALVDREDLEIQWHLVGRF